MERDVHFITTVGVFVLTAVLMNSKAILYGPLVFNNSIGQSYELLRSIITYPWTTDQLAKWITTGQSYVFYHHHAAVTTNCVYFYITSLE